MTDPPPHLCARQTKFINCLNLLPFFPPPPTIVRAFYRNSTSTILPLPSPPLPSPTNQPQQDGGGTIGIIAAKNASCCGTIPSVNSNLFVYHNISERTRFGELHFVRGYRSRAVPLPSFSVSKSKEETDGEPLSGAAAHTTDSYFT